MKVNVITIFPGIFDGFAELGITRQAIDRGILELASHDLRDYSDNTSRSVDDRPYGGGPGMVMSPQPLARCIDAVQAGPLVYLTPQGEKLDQAVVAELSELPALTLLAGRYEGIDERIVESRVDREISVGDYVLAGGEVAAMVVIESMVRLLPGVLGNSQSASQDSFSAGILDCPHYTRPEVFEGMAVPEVLLGGDHEQIRAWRARQALARTRRRRPDLLGERIE